MTEVPVDSRSLSSAAFEVVEIDSDHVKAVAHNLVFMIWRFRTLAPAYRASMALIEARSLSYPEGIGVLQVVEAEAIPPDKRTRQAFKEALELRSIQHFSVIHEAPGFTAASVRAIVSAAYMLARPTFAHAVHSSIHDAAGWAAKQNARLGRHDDPRNLETIIQALRRLHRERYPGAGP